MQTKLTQSDLHQKLEQVSCAVFDVDGVLTDGKLYFSDDATEQKAFNARDGLGLKLLMGAGIEVAIITGRVSASSHARLVDNLGIKHYFEGSTNKLDTLNKLLQRSDWDYQNILYVGDDLVDIGIMQKVGVSVAVNDADPIIKEIADIVLDATGGYGAAREICEQILITQGKWQKIIKDFQQGLELTN